MRFDMRYLVLALLLYISASSNIVRAQSILYIRSPIINSNSIIYIKCPDCNLKKEKDTSRSINKVFSSIKKDIIKGKNVEIYTDNFMREEETFIKDIWQDKVKADKPKHN
ncbi:MAG: hypothetical protein C4617_04235 [Candidatus Liberibacter europaeus]|uniref:Uncharacterized protein n=1 Tax=Candidatus Liberibacter europaeus TaxID=744859 RepID=A0A2T4VXA9_9HYPH|nr:hypothetical protein [Candidatus Liberibacter europaeus]PTL86412.1 MAG: hypothetical protein C4617_04235 [Candidatus Liberibacter europaeus]